MRPERASRTENASRQPGSSSDSSEPSETSLGETSESARSPRAPVFRNDLPNLRKEAIVAIGLGAAKASGLTAYQCVSFALSGAATATGLKVSFCTYVAPTTAALGWISGPAGWAALGAGALYKIYRSRTEGE